MADYVLGRGVSYGAHSTMRKTSFALLGLVALSLPGCIAVAAGAAAGYGTAQIVRNADVRDYAAPLPVVWAATLASVREAGYPVALDTPADPTAASIAVNDLTVSLWAIAEGQTRVRLRVGTFNTDAHRRVTAQIHDGISARVGR
jgi:hypothetical protein